jgi:hypothetical protein
MNSISSGENVRYHHILDRTRESRLKPAEERDADRRFGNGNGCALNSGLRSRYGARQPASSRFNAQAVYIDENDCVFVSSELKDLFSLSDKHSR